MTAKTYTPKDERAEAESGLRECRHPTDGREHVVLETASGWANY